MGGVWWEVCVVGGKTPRDCHIFVVRPWLWLEFLREFGYIWSFGKHHGYINPKKIIKYISNKCKIIAGRANEVGLESTTLYSKPKDFSLR